MSEEAAVRREVAPMNILIVDDELAIRETCSVVAEQCGMRATGVATAEEALEVLEHSAVDILLTDLKLPQANGVELLKVVHDLHPRSASWCSRNTAPLNRPWRLPAWGLWTM
jgi:CheY-like chemotaxis protein